MRHVLAPAGVNVPVHGASSEESMRGQIVCREAPRAQPLHSRGGKRAGARNFPCDGERWSWAWCGEAGRNGPPEGGLWEKVIVCAVGR